MLKFSCPSCGADIVFKSKASVFAICSYCKSAVVRHDLNLELYGKMAELQEDLSPFQIGTKGFYEGQTFELIGRLRMAWSDGFWNEWFALMIDGSEAWLAEAQGFYMFSFPETVLSLPDDLRIGEKYKLENIKFEVDDIKETTCLGSEGELPFPSLIGRKALNADLSSPEGQYFASSELETNGNKKLYIGKYLHFDEFNFSNLREIEGWSNGH